MRREESGRGEEEEKEAREEGRQGGRKGGREGGKEIEEMRRRRQEGADSGEGRSPNQCI